MKAVLDALQNVTLRLVSEGQSLRLGDLGSFRPTLTSKGKDAPEQVKASDIKSVRVRFSSDIMTSGQWTIGAAMKWRTWSPKDSSSPSLTVSGSRLSVSSGKN